MNLHTPLSVVIITFNEEANIKRCIESVLTVADEIVIVDSFSTDKTKNICQNFSNVKFFERAWKGYSDSKNVANSLSTNDWILSLDADEVLSEPLIESILDLKKTGLKKAKFNRITNYCGHWVKYGGWYPDTKTRLFNKNHTYWIGAIHEELSNELNEPSLQLTGNCLHYSYYSIDQHLKQADKFTTIQANDLFVNHKKSSYLKIIFSPIVKFIKDYFVKAGFLDGKTGFLVAIISAKATYMKYRKLMNLQLNKSN